MIGLRILDLSTVVAGPLAATLLADLGADVLKIELPSGRDGLRHLPPHKDGVPLWWKVGNRNKRGVTLDVRKPEGRDLFLRMVSENDVLVENFRTGTMDRWGLDREALFEANPKLTILRVTGFGQTGPYRDRPGFARVFDAMSGFAYLNGEEGGPPLNLGYPISDAVSGLFGSMAILAAIYERRNNPDAPGQEIDLAGTEAMFRIIDSLAIEYDQLGVVRERIGNKSSYSAPSNIYRTRDGKWLSIAISMQSVFERFCRAMDRSDLLDDPRFADNQIRCRYGDVLDDIVAAWIESRDLSELITTLTNHEITFSPVYSIRDVFEDRHFQEREMIVPVADKTLGELRMQCVVPKFSRTPGSVKIPGPDLGEHNREVYEAMGLSEAEIDRLRRNGVI